MYQIPGANDLKTQIVNAVTGVLVTRGGILVKVPFPNYADDPTGFAHEILRVEHLTAKQREILESVRDNRITNVQAGFGVGKTFLASLLVLWWVFSVGGVCVTTAKTKRQVERLFWGEVRKKYDERAWLLGGTRTETRVILSERYHAWGFTASEYSEESATGAHDAKLLAIMDEANGISKEIDSAFRGWTAGADNRGLRIGNPTKDGTPFARHCQRSSIQISCFDHPNVTWAYDHNHEMPAKISKAVMDGEELKPRKEWPKWCQVEDLIPGAVSVEYLEDLRSDPMVGPGSPYWDSRVLGNFPSDASTSLVPRSWFKAARARYDSNPGKWESEAAEMPWTHGLDVGDGVDDHCLTSRRGDLLLDIQVRGTKGDRRDNSRAVALVVAVHDGSVALGPARPGVVHVDTGGVGSGVMSAILTDDDLNIDVREIFFGARPTSSKRRKLFRLLRDQMLWGLRSRFQEGNIAVAPLGTKLEHRLQEELATIEWELDLAGRIMIEKKDAIKKKLGYSPDVVDSAAMAFHVSGPRTTKSSDWSK